MVSTRFCDAAKMSGVWPHSCSFALTSALASSSNRTASTLPERGGQVQRRHAARRAHRRDVGVGADQRLDDGGVAGAGGDVERRVLADARHGADVGAAVDEDVGQFEIAALGGPVQRGHAVALRAR